MDAKDALTLSSRRKIYNYILKYPGVHMRDIRKNLNMQMGMLQHHLDVLQKMELVSFQMEGSRKRFFVREGVAPAHRNVLAFVRLKRHREILMHILMKNTAGFGEMVVEFGMKKSTLSFHLKKLVGAGLIVEKRSERSKIYQVADPDTLARVLVTYKESFLDDAVDRFVEVWTGL